MVKEWTGDHFITKCDICGVEIKNSMMAQAMGKNAVQLPMWIGNRKFVHACDTHMDILSTKFNELVESITKQEQDFIADLKNYQTTNQE